jgi:hypothetical protein
LHRKDPDIDDTFSSSFPRIEEEGAPMNKLTPTCSPAVIRWALLLASAGTIFGQYTISTLASSSATGTVLNGLGVAVDSSGNVYATGTMPGGNGLGAFPVILKINNSGISTSWAAMVRFIE